MIKINEKHHLALAFICMLLISSCTNSQEEKIPWVSIFDGETLDDWTPIGGEATYEVNDGIITGITTPNTPNTFLTTDKMYGDFILELDFKVDPTINSGIQIRSNSYPNHKNGRFHGYQVEIDPSDRSWSGGIYDESRRGWINNLENNPEARNAFKQNEWNHYRIEAIGDTIRTWINGVPAAHLIDDQTSMGRLGLQVHSIGKPEQAGKFVQWKNINILTEDLSKYSKSSTIAAVRPPINVLSDNEAEEGWKLLWDGKTTNGWRGARLDHFPKKGWEIKDGVLSVLASGGAESAAGGDIVTTDQYGDFELKVDFRITEGANSGIKYYVNTDLNKGPGSSIGLEFQILDDAKHPDASQGSHEGSRTVASLYDLIKASPDKHMNPIGDWNTAHIISKDNHVEHWLNGAKVLEYERKSKDYRKLVAGSKYAKWPKFGEADKGPILLQDHGDLVSFKNIKIKTLD